MFKVVNKDNRFFETRRINNLIEVWIPPVNDFEGELVLSIHELFLPALIAVLRNEQDSNRRP